MCRKLFRQPGALPPSRLHPPTPITPNQLNSIPGAGTNPFIVRGMAEALRQHRVPETDGTQVEVQGVVMKDCKIVELPSGRPTVLGADSIVPGAKTIEKRKECH
jgi:hypothetical protein